MTSWREYRQGQGHKRRRAREMGEFCWIGLEVEL